MARGKVLTWDQLQRRGFHGPSRCVLCERNEEDNFHLFLACPFSIRIKAYFEAKFGFSWPVHSSVSSFLAQWYSSFARIASFRYLPIFIFWGLWLLHNCCLFENKKPVVSALISKVEGLLSLYTPPKKIKKIRHIGCKPVKVFPCAFFDGAATKNIGGFGFVIYLNNSHFFSFSLGIGSSTNTRAELLAL